MASASRVASSLSNRGGASGTRGLAKGGNPRANSTVKEGNSPAGMKNGVRRNGMMAGASQSSGDSSGSDSFLGPYKHNNESFRPTKSGSPR